MCIKRSWCIYLLHEIIFKAKIHTARIHVHADTPLFVQLGQLQELDTRPHEEGNVRDQKPPFITINI